MRRAGSRGRTLEAPSVRPSRRRAGASSASAEKQQRGRASSRPERRQAADSAKRLIAHRGRRIGDARGGALPSPDSEGSATIQQSRAAKQHLDRLESLRLSQSRPGLVQERQDFGVS